MFVDFLLLVSLGPIIAFFIVYLTNDRQKSKEYFDEQRNMHLEM